MTTHHKHRHHVIKKHTAKLTPKSDTEPVSVKVDLTARFREIQSFAQNKDINRSMVDPNLIICQIYAESKFDSHDANPQGAKGLMQLLLSGAKQGFKYKKQQELGHMPSDAQTKALFAEGEKFYNGAEIFDDIKNIQVATEYLKYCIDTTSTLAAAFAAYRGRNDGIYYNKISTCASRLKQSRDPLDSLNILQDVLGPP